MIIDPPPWLPSSEVLRANRKVPDYFRLPTNQKSCTHPSSKPLILLLGVV
jgi:hypothetical protein